MIDYCKMINKFNSLKWDRLREITGVKYKPAFLELENEIARKVWIALEQNINFGVDGIEEHTCIFCIYDLCAGEDCEWAKQNGLCDNIGSVYVQTMRIIEGMEILHLFDTDYYKKILKKVYQEG